jgi:hypothetical protein
MGLKGQVGQLLERQVQDHWPPTEMAKPAITKEDLDLSRDWNWWSLSPRHSALTSCGLSNEMRISCGLSCWRPHNRSFHIVLEG